MEPEELLAELRKHAANIPDDGTDTEISQEFLNWYGRVKVLLLFADPRHESNLNVHQTFFGYSLLRQNHVQQIRVLITNEIQKLEVMLGPQIQPAYGPGAQYDFYRSLRTLIQSAKQELFLIDPYIDRDAFDLYLGDLNPAVNGRVLTNKYANSLKPVIKILATKHKGVEVRSSGTLHDRIFFIDSAQCWVIGQSIKDAAEKKPTYLAPLPSEVVTMKLAAYDLIWKNAMPVKP